MTDRIGRQKMLGALLLVASVGLFSAGIAATLEPLLVLIAIFIGIFLLGCSLLPGVMTVNLYPTASHATGLGWAFGLGRFEAIAAPILDGFAISLGWPPLVILSGAALFPVFAGFAQSCSCG